MKFKDFKYERPNYNLVKKTLIDLTQKLKDSDNIQEQKNLIHEINSVRNNVSSMSSIVNIRHTINTEDKFYDSENEYFLQILLKIYRKKINKFQNM